MVLEVGANGGELRLPPEALVNLTVAEVVGASLGAAVGMMGLRVVAVLLRLRRAECAVARLVAAACSALLRVRWVSGCLCTGVGRSFSADTALAAVGTDVLVTIWTPDPHRLKWVLPLSEGTSQMRSQAAGAFSGYQASVVFADVLAERRWRGRWVGFLGLAGGWRPGRGVEVGVGARVSQSVMVMVFIM